MGNGRPIGSGMGEERAKMHHWPVKVVEMAGDGDRPVGQSTKM